MPHVATTATTVSTNEATTHQCRNRPQVVPSAMTIPVASAPIASGTITQPVMRPIAIQAPRTVPASTLVAAVTSRAT